MKTLIILIPLCAVIAGGVVWIALRALSPDQRTASLGKFTDPRFVLPFLVGIAVGVIAFLTLGR